jgi:hypothetical protein
MADKTPVYRALRRIETTTATMDRVPLISPAAPMPAMARPTIRKDEDVAAPDRREPSSKIEKNVKNVHCVKLGSQTTCDY